LYKAALDSMQTLIKAATTSMTSVPKPLKFLRPHYDTLKTVYEKVTDPATKVISALSYFSAYVFLIIAYEH